MRTIFRNAAAVSAAMIVVTLVANVAAGQRGTPRAPQPTAQPAPRPAVDGRAAQAAQPKPTPQAALVEAGATAYKKNGCYECHVNEAQGGPQGPRLGPNPIPFPRFVTYVRNPTGDMPPFTAKVLSDQDLAGIYAFLQARPQPPPVNSIPLLAP